MINAFPGYKHYPGPENRGKGRNMYRGIDLGFGGYVYAETGMYYNVALIDISNMHGASILAMNCFGDHTHRYAEMREARTLIKHRDFENARKILDGALAPFLDSEENADALSNALKTALNSCYGLTSASFPNPMRDPRNVNNIVALRGALFMKTLQDILVEKGFGPIHIKTDSMKIPGATPEIIQFCMDFAKEYGYEFEHEATYDRMCLVNNAVYIAKYDDKGIRNKGGKHANEWTATGKQFAVPYVFKTLFSHEPIEFEDKFETINVTTALYLDMNENLPDVSMYEKELAKLRKNTPNDITRMIDLENRIQLGHNYIFVGKTGAFCPIKPGSGGGWLVRTNNSGGFDSAVGTKGYRWMEAEIVKKLGKENDIDLSYYSSLIDAAKASINEFGDFEAFAD